MSKRESLKKQEMLNLSLAPKFTISFWWGLPGNIHEKLINVS
jgi:hypothetical protein